MIEDILPSAVAAAEAFDDPPGIELFPAEEAAIAKAVDKRRREFTTARSCARDALAQLGLPPSPIVPGPRGAPQWPTGVTGSITHCAGYRAAVAARRGAVASVGVDAEPDAPLPDGVADVIMLAEEQQMITTLLASQPGVSWDRLLFCAKESVYKAWFPLTQRWLDFSEARITIDPAAGTFAARLLVPGPALGGRVLDGFAGRWLARRGLLVTAITVTT